MNGAERIVAGSSGPNLRETTCPAGEAPLVTLERLLLGQRLIYRQDALN